MENKRGRIRRINSQNITLAIIATLSASIALADDFKTVDGKEYKSAQVSRVEPDGIVLKTKSGITKVYFTELPKGCSGTVSLRFCDANWKGSHATHRQGRKHQSRHPV